MVAALYLLLALALGIAFTRWLGLSFWRLEAAAIAIITGLFGFSWIILLPALMMPYWLALPLGAILVMVVTALLWQRGRSHQLKPTPRSITIIWSLIAALSALFWGWLMFSHDLLPVSGTLVSAGSTWGDFGYHASVISHQAAATKLPLDLPVANGVGLAYYFLIDFLSAVFIRGGWPIGLAIALPGALLAWSLTQLVISFGWRLFGRFGGAVLGLILAFTNASAAGLGVAWSDWRHSGLSLVAWLHHVPQNYSGLDSLNAHFNNAVADLLLPQRPFLFGLGLWLVIATLWLIYTHQPRTKILYAGAILLGLLPLGHTYSFLTGGILFASLFIWAWIHRPHDRRSWLTAAGIIAIIALPQIIWLQATGGSATAGFPTAGWDRLPGESLMGFEWRNFGLSLLVFAGLAAALFQRPLRRYIPWVAPFLALFVAAQLYSMQTFAYDNLKLLFYAYFMAMIALGALIWHARSWYKYALAALAIACLSLPGMLTITREFQQQDLFASADDISLATWVKTHTTPAAVFAATDSPNQPVATLAGRNLVFGYRGWLYSRHLDYSRRQTAISDLLNGSAATTAVTTYQPDYLIVNANEPAEWTVNRPALTSFDQVYQNITWTVYRLPK